MTLRQQHHLHCDGPGCGRVAPWSHPMESEVRIMAREASWMRDGKRDLCPDCRRKVNRLALAELEAQQARRGSGGEV
jgi:hypothetical protein